ncbi:MAG: ATP-dependent Clp protease proteolytic subunit [Deltaproteobacteria bacterium HGW-Deltaproteobacteria-14]|jgi:ATP-dependent Clp protease protease subunit|nr:MAG: ATP-dependent Clp protease proteolytic subunit [Deltaproteobacteria bacterium HGW-Deltaproteobacteria-14]
MSHRLDHLIAQSTAPSQRVVDHDPDDDDDNGKDKDQGKNWQLDYLRKTRTIELFGPVNNALAKKVISGLFFLEADDPERPITIVQNSPGGSVTDGFAIYDAMRFVKPDVRVVCVGLTASIATITLLGAKKEHRVTLPNTEFLIHQPLIPGTVYGRAADLEITARNIIKTRERINRMLSDATGQPLEVVESHTQRDYWMSADEAVNYGLVARIVNSREELEAL